MKREGPRTEIWGTKTYNDLLHPIYLHGPQISRSVIWICPQTAVQAVHSTLNFTLKLKEYKAETHPQEIPASAKSSHPCAWDLEISFIQFSYIWHLCLMSYPYSKPFKTRSLCLVWATALISGVMYPTFLGPPASLSLCYLFITSSQPLHSPTTHPHFLLWPVARLGQAVCLGTPLCSLHSACPSPASLLTKPGIWERVHFPQKMWCSLPLCSLPLKLESFLSYYL